jgi:hypothetical protein
MGEVQDHLHKLHVEKQYSLPLCMLPCVWFC